MPPQAAPLEDGIVNCAASITQNLVSRGQLQVFTAQTIMNTIRSNIDTIANNIRRTCNQYGRNITEPDVNDAVINTISQLLAQQNQQQSFQPQYQFQQPTLQPAFQQQQPFYQQPAMQMAQPSFQPQQTRAYWDNPNQQPTQVAQPVPQPIPQTQSAPMKPTKLLAFGDVSNQSHQFDLIDDRNYLGLGLKTETTGSLIDVTSKAVINDRSTNETFNYFTCNNNVTEPCLGYVVDKFLDTTQKMTQGKFIIDMAHTLFVLKKFRYQKNDPIDLSPFNTEDPFPVVAQKIIDNLSIMSTNNVNTVNSLIAYEFADLVKRFVRTNSNIDKVITLNEVKDVFELLSNTFSHYDTTSHENYRMTVMRCFKQAVQKIIFEYTRCGYYDQTAIIPELISSPKFVLRDNNMFERECDFENKDIISAINLKYTVFGVKSDVIITNHADIEFLNDLHQVMILRYKPGCTFNVFAYLMDVYGHKPKTIIYCDGDNKTIIKNGVTLDGVPFFFKEDVDLEYHL